MPELPEVQTVVTTLRPVVLGKVIRAVALYRPDMLSPCGFDLVANLSGRRIVELARRGKKIVFTLDNGNRFYIHLGMTGRLSAGRAETEMEPHTHFTFDVDERECVQIRFRDPRRFGGIWWLGTENSADTNMGPEPLTISASQLAKRLTKTTRAVKNALLDQSVIAGLGNIYVDESLFRARLHPLQPADQLTADEIATLTRAIKFILRRAINHRGSTLRDYFDSNGEPGAFQRFHSVYDRAGKECRKCGTSIERIVLGGRSTHFCPKCQISPLSVVRGQS